MIRTTIFSLVLSTAAVASAATTVRTVTVTSNDLAYDATNARFYASIPSSVGAGGNALRVINPATATLGASVFVGSEPTNVAVSDNGQYAYVGLSGAAAVRRVTLSTYTADLQFTLGADNFLGLYYVEDMEVVPGQPQSLAVSRRNVGYSPKHEGVAIYDDGVKRTVETPGHTGSNVIEFGATASTLYGYNNETTDYGLRTMSVTPSGVQITSQAQLISGFGVDIDYGGGKLVSTSGRVINPVTQTLLGTIGSGNSVVVEPNGNTAYVLQNNAIKIYDLNTFLLQDTITVAGLSGGVELLRFGTDGLAVRTGTQVYLVNSNLIPEPASLTAIAGAGLLLARRRRASATA